MRLYHIAALICISVMNNDVKHIFRHLLDIWISSFLWGSYSSFVPFFKKWIVHLSLIYMSLSLESYFKYLLQAHGCFFVLLMIILINKILNFNVVQSVNFLCKVYDNCQDY